MTGDSMSTATAWSAELAASGRVVFPPRRNRLLVRLALFALLMVSSLWSNIDHLRQDDVAGALGILRVTALLAFVYGVGLTTWQLATRRPEVTVDSRGVQLGRSDRGLIPWHQISRINDPTGFPGLRTVQIHAAGFRSGAIGIPQDNVEDLAELSAWLRGVHADKLTP
ncbi:hypothetical protein [Kribbella italica]|uniref:PH domain-containing protein n=1 Tax=Kribbella italica TaxID=1540520 RepID=A0A7W9J8C8_9ACTN|nr:hypothetical protein [Kribbella italica]MBB5837499.1 hypothetical protein [Kribbella italica]